jgi:hypothetical protein
MRNKKINENNKRTELFGLDKKPSNIISRQEQDFYDYYTRGKFRGMSKYDLNNEVFKMAQRKDDIGILAQFCLQIERESISFDNILKDLIKKLSENVNLNMGNLEDILNRVEEEEYRREDVVEIRESKMKWIKTFESISEIERLCNEYRIENWTINSEGLVDVEGNVNLSFQELKQIPINFGKVGGDFHCGFNKLTTLEGVPREVGGDFYCNVNKLTTLKGAPNRVDGDFYCRNNELTTLEGIPSRVNGGFYCCHNQLTTLEGIPSRVYGGFSCRDNQLTTLEGAPNRVDGDFECQNNQLWTFHGAPEFIGGKFICHGNKISEIWYLFEMPKYIDWLNDHKAIRMGEDEEPYVILDRLNAFLEDIGKEPATKLRNYKTI